MPLKYFYMNSFSYEKLVIYIKVAKDTTPIAVHIPPPYDVTSHTVKTILLDK